MPTIGAGSAHGFWRTTFDLLFHPTRFFRTLTVRGPVGPARRFARVHWLFAATLFGIAAATHVCWYSFSMYAFTWPFPHKATPAVYAAMVIVLAGVTYLALDGITRLAARLTHWEASYRGLRLPYSIVLRGLYYHAAHYAPVGIIAAGTVVAYQLLLADGLLGVSSATAYLYVLSGEVILSAVYLFNTYWIGMRNMMYANR